MALCTARNSMKTTQVSIKTTPPAPVLGFRPIGRRAAPHQGSPSPVSIAPLNAYIPANQAGGAKSSRRQRPKDKDDEKRVVLGWHATRNKQEERESVMTWLLLFGFFMSGMFFVVPEIMMFVPAILKAMFGEAAS